MENFNKTKLNIKDLVTTGIFSALLLVFTMIGGILFAPNPALTFLLPLSVALITGPVYLLLIAKVPKQGPIVIASILLGFMLLITGMYFLWTFVCIGLALIANLIAKKGNYKNFKLNAISYMVFSLHPMGSYLMIWINRQSYFNYLVGKGTETTYVEIMNRTAENWMLPAMILGTLVMAFISCLLGKFLLKKQFSKAGII